MRTFKNNKGLFISAIGFMAAGAFILLMDGIAITNSYRLRGHVVRSHTKREKLLSPASNRTTSYIEQSVTYKTVLFRTPEGKRRRFSVKARDIKDDYFVEVLYNPESLIEARVATPGKISKSFNVILFYTAISCFIFSALLWFIILTSKDEDDPNFGKEKTKKYSVFDFLHDVTNDHESQNEYIKRQEEILEEKRSNRKTVQNSTSKPKKKK